MNSNSKIVIWLGRFPLKCDTCSADIKDTFFDAATKFGPWANMCPTCQTLGPGLNQVGPGKGQKYVKQEDGKFHKVEG